MFDNDESLDDMMKSLSKPISDMVGKGVAAQVASQLYVSALKDKTFSTMNTDELYNIAKHSIRAANVFVAAAQKEFDMTEQMLEMFKKLG